MQRPVRLGQLWRSHLLSREEAAYMQAMARNHFDDIMAVLKALPRPMLLVLRNVNTVRAINIALGAPVDRYFLMAKRWVLAGPRAGGRHRAGQAQLTCLWQRGQRLEPPGGRSTEECLRHPRPPPCQGCLGDVQV